MTAGSTQAIVTTIQQPDVTDGKQDVIIARRKRPFPPVMRGIAPAVTGDKNNEHSLASLLLHS